VLNKTSALNKEVASWTGTAEQLRQRLEIWVEKLGLNLEVPTVRVIRSWVTKGLFSNKDKRRFGGRQLLESLAVLLLQDKGWSLKSIGEMLSRFSDSELSTRIINGSEADWGIKPEGTIKLYSRSEENIEASIVLLAQGLMRLFNRVLLGDIVRQDDTLPRELQAAMFMLGRMYIEQGEEDQAACIHDVLDRARKPLCEWGLTPFSTPNFQFRDVVLLEPDLRVPTPDCGTIALSNGFGEEELIENRLHQRLREAVERLGNRQDMAYSRFREFIGRFSLTTEDEIGDWLREHNLTPLSSLIEEFYDAVPDSWLVSGKANRCKYCGSLLRPYPGFPNGRCSVRQCSTKHHATVGSHLTPGRLKVCRPQVLTYWTGPAVDELLIFDEAVKVGLDAKLYPDGDRCDISIGEKTGIDVKGYSSPITLALRLNQSIGGLIYYEHKIIAISDELAQRKGYMESLKDSLDPTSEASMLDIMKVSTIIKKLQKGAYA
jgi:DNA-binding transcriptional MerR regulator